MCDAKHRRAVRWYLAASRTCFGCHASEMPPSSDRSLTAVPCARKSKQTADSRNCVAMDRIGLPLGSKLAKESTLLTGGSAAHNQALAAWMADLNFCCGSYFKERLSPSRVMVPTGGANDCCHGYKAQGGECRLPNGSICLKLRAHSLPAV